MYLRQQSNPKRPRGRRSVRTQNVKNTYYTRDDESRLKLHTPSTKMSIMRSPFFGLPQQLTVKLRYYENSFTFDLGTLDKINKIPMSLNDPYDPYANLGGKSANEFQAIMSHYRWSKVDRAKITVRATQPAFEANKNMLLALFVNPNFDPIVDQDDLFSQDNRLMTKPKSFTDIISSTLTVSREYAITDIFKYTPLQYEAIPPDTAFYNYNNGSSISSPSKLANIDIVYARLDDNQSNAISFRGDVTIDFLITFFDKITTEEAGN